jgi:transcriptional regulator with XRE-family HTH domain
MTQTLPETFGQRVQRMRKLVGFKSSRSLAEAINNPLISESVIRNIENGRKAEVSIVHLLEIAWAIGVSPLVLLLNYSAPARVAGIPGLGPNFAPATVEEIDEWIAMPWAYDAVRYSTELLYDHGAVNELAKISVTRDYRRLVMERDNIKWEAKKRADLQRRLGHDEYLDVVRNRWGTYENLLDEVRRRAKWLGVDLGEEEA